MISRGRPRTRGCAKCVARPPGSTATTEARSACHAEHSSGDPYTQVRQICCNIPSHKSQSNCQLNSNQDNKNTVGLLAWMGNIYLFRHTHTAHTAFAKYNFLTNVNSANEAEGYRYMARIITPGDVTIIYCVWAAIVPFHSMALVFWSVIILCKLNYLQATTPPTSAPSEDRARWVYGPASHVSSVDMKSVYRCGQIKV